MSRFDAVLFDFGRTLFDHDPEPVLLAREAARLGRPVSDAVAAELWDEIHAAAMDPAEVALGRDLDARVWATRWKVLYGLADRLLPGLGAALDRVMLDPATWIPYAGTEAVLAAARAAGVAVGVISNTGWDVRAPFRSRRLEGLIDEWILSWEVGMTKPDPAIFELACRRLRSEPGRTLMVGDDPVADGGATGAGLPVLLLPGGIPPGGCNGLDAVAQLVAR